MIISEFAQGTPEWLKERAGIPTSSSFDMIITTTGKPSKQREKYLYSLAAERITGVKLDHYQSKAMQSGIEAEAQARAMYEILTGNEVKEVGVCFPDKRKLYGCSPDGLILDSGSLEIKCPLAHTHVGYLLNRRVPTAYQAQIQGQLLVTGRRWVDFFSFYPDLEPLLIKVERDEVFIKALQVELEIFTKELDEITKKLGGKK